MESRNVWQQIEIGHKQAEYFAPSVPKPDRAIIYLHAHGEERLSENPVMTTLFEQHQIPVVCPRGKKCWWLSRICEEFDPVASPMQFVRETVVSWIEETLHVSPPRVALFGISMGGQGALNLAYRHALQFPIVAAIGSAIDFNKAYGQGFPLDRIFESAEEARQESPLLHLHPLNWPKYQFFACDPLDKTWYEGNEILASKLSSSGVPFECDLKTSHGGHNWTYFNQMADRALTFIDQAFDNMGSA